MRIRQLNTRPAPQALRDFLSRGAPPRPPAETVQRRQIPYWQERGWRRQGNAYTGSYQTAFASFPGRIVEHWGGRIDFFLHGPSRQLQNHSHFVCFQGRADDWYLIHMAEMPEDVSSGIITIEHLIAEAYER